MANWNGHDEASVKLIHEAGADWAFYNGGNRWTFGVYMYKAVRQSDMKFRLSWHWNCVAGDPYYALDCREDDYAWCNSTPDGKLVPAVHFERVREGLDDYRRMLTLARLAKSKAGTRNPGRGAKPWMLRSFYAEGSWPRRRAGRWPAMLRERRAEQTPLPTPDERLQAGR